MPRHPLMKSEWSDTDASIPHKTHHVLSGLPGPQKPRCLHDEYRKKKYVKHYPLFDLNDNKDDLKNTLENDNYIYTFKFPKNNPQKNLISKRNYFLSYNSKLDESKLGKTLYKVLPVKINNFFTKRFESKKREFPKIRNNALTKKLNSVNFGIKKINPIDIIKSKNKPIFFISKFSPVKIKIFVLNVFMI